MLLKEDMVKACGVRVNLDWNEDWETAVSPCLARVIERNIDVFVPLGSVVVEDRIDEGVGFKHAVTRHRAMT